MPSCLGECGCLKAAFPKQEGTCPVKASHNLARVSVTFDEDHLLPNGGLAVTGLAVPEIGRG